jgi:hypothetical protein
MPQSNEATIIGMNRTICEFLGWEFREDAKYEYMAYFEGQQMWCDNLQGVNKILLKGFKYHEDWNKLMPVVKKIQHLKIEEFPKKKPVMAALIDVDISTLHEAVFVFCQWYNKNKPNGE